MGWWARPAHWGAVLLLLACGCAASPLGPDVHTYARVTCECADELGHGSPEICEDRVLDTLQAATCLGRLLGPTDPYGTTGTGTAAAQLCARRAFQQANTCMADVLCEDSEVRDACRSELAGALAECSGIPASCIFIE